MQSCSTSEVPAQVYMVIGGGFPKDRGAAPVPTHISAVEQIKLDPAQVRVLDPNFQGRELLDGRNNETSSSILLSFNRSIYPFRLLSLTIYPSGDVVLLTHLQLNLRRSYASADNTTALLVDSTCKVPEVVGFSSLHIQPKVPLSFVEQESHAGKSRTVPSAAHHLSSLKELEASPRADFFFMTMLKGSWRRAPVGHMHGHEIEEPLLQYRSAVY